MEVTVDKLLQIIGSLQVELMMMRAEIERMKQAEKDRDAEKRPPHLQTVT